MYKKLIFLAMLVCFLVIGLVFVSCDGGSSKLVGTWRYIQDGYIDVNTGEAPFWDYEFSKDGKGSHSINGNFSWKVEKNRITITYPSGNSELYDYKKISDTTLTFTYKNEIVMKLEKR